MIKGRGGTWDLFWKFLQLESFYFHHWLYHDEIRGNNDTENKNVYCCHGNAAILDFLIANNKEFQNVSPPSILFCFQWKLVFWQFRSIQRAVCMGFFIFLIFDFSQFFLVCNIALSQISWKFYRKSSIFPKLCRI